MKKTSIFLMLYMGLFNTAWAAGNEYTDRIKEISRQIQTTAEELKEATGKPVFHSLEAGRILAELKDYIKEYENLMAFAESPYPGEILLGTTPGGDGAWLETLCDSRYDGLTKEIRIRRIGSSASYLRINDIEITSITPQGPRTETFNKDGRYRLYRNGVFRLALPRPMKIKRIRISTAHESNGLEIYAIPYNLPVARPDINLTNNPNEVLLGTTPAGNDSWIETLCSNPGNRPIREIILRRTGREASYLRINDIELTYLTPRGPEKETFNKNGRFKLYYDGFYKFALPRPMRVVKIRILIAHKSTGLNVYGVY
ncbi:MAG: hypothetical protein JW715_05000 [Sedimentisphaerales bacterium]|nr:hypothetical protein [Sedimentisphaerales bacterium]